MLYNVMSTQLKFTLQAFFDKFKANPNLESTVQVWIMPYTMGPTYVKGALHYPTDKLLTGIIVNKTYCTVHL